MIHLVLNITTVWENSVTPCSSRHKILASAGLMGWITALAKISDPKAAWLPMQLEHLS